MNDDPSFPYQQMLEDCIFSNHNDHQIEIIPKEADVSASLNWISNSILNASSKQLVRSINIAANLEERINRMQKIIDLTSDSTRVQLLMHVEQLNIAHTLLHYQKAVVSDQTPHRQLLQNVLESMNPDNPNQFYEYPDILLFIEYLQQPLSALPPAQSLGEEERLLVHEISQILSLCFSTAIHYHKTNAPYYQVSQSQQEWMASPKLLDALQVQFEYNLSILESLSTGDSLWDQLAFSQCELASFILYNIESQKDSIEANNGDVQALNTRASILTSKLYSSLESLGKISACFQLAENYRDFNILAHLISIISETKRASKIQGYINKFGTDFTQVLYDSYLDAQDYHSILGADPETLEIYLESHPEISWIHYISTGRFREASKTLWEIAEDSTILAHQKAATSIGMLCYIESQEQGDLDPFTDSLNFILLQTTIQQDMKDNGGIELFMMENFKCDPAHHDTVKRALERIAVGSACDAKQVIDILTLHGSSQYLAEAFELITEFQLDRQTEYLHTFWRRVYSMTNWNANQLYESNLLELMNMVDPAMFISPANVEGSGWEQDVYEKLRVRENMDDLYTQALVSLTE